MNGERLVKAVIDGAAQLEQMAAAARGLSRPGATRRVADLLEDLVDS
jgi:UDP-N-acetylglucosamine:LPS N-acetylglucosamine transferase